MAISSLPRLFGTIVLNLLLVTSHACSRLAYTSEEADGLRVVVGRTTDWFAPTDPSLYAFPAGMKRNGCAGEKSLKWTSKYGSVISTMNECLTIDGINTEGLTGNILYLSGTDWGRYNASRPQISVSLWLQYYLDNYPTVAAVLEDLFDESGLEKFQVAAPQDFQGCSADGHISLVDGTGVNLILEWIGGKLKIYHSPEYRVMTNEPSYDEQLALDAYWRKNGNITLPGTDRPADRFARLAHYARRAPKSKNGIEALAITQSLMRAVSVPLQGESADIPDMGPNVSPTLWRVYTDIKDRKYFFESVTEPVFIWISLDDLDLSPKGRVKKLSVAAPKLNHEGRRGDVTKEFYPSKPYTPLEIRPGEWNGPDYADATAWGVTPDLQTDSPGQQVQDQYRVSIEL